MRTPRTPSYRLHKPSGKAVVTLNGHDHYLGTHGTPESRAAYDKLISAWLANGRRPTRRHNAEPTIDDGPTLAEVVVLFLKHAERYYVKNGKQTHEVHGFRTALRPIVDLFAELPAADFSPTALRRCREWLADGDLCRTYLNKQVNRIRHAFRWAVGQELVAPDVLAKLREVEGLKKGRTEDGIRAREKEAVRPVEDTVVEATLPHLPRQLAAMVRLQLLTGMRPGEVTAMRTFFFYFTGSFLIYTPSSHKTEHHDQNRSVPIGPVAQDILRPFLRADPNAFLFSPREVEEERRAKARAARKTPLTPSQRARTPKSRPKRTPGEHYTTSSYYRAINRACDRAFPPPTELRCLEPAEERARQLKSWHKAHRWHPNQLRHAFATRVRSEFGLEEAQVSLGHKKADVTQIYAERNAALAMKVAGEIG